LTTFFELILYGEDAQTDGKWCYLVFWVVGKPNTRWGLLKKRLLEVCPSYFSTSEFDYYKPENQQPKPPDVFLLKFWCAYDREGLLHGNPKFLSGEIVPTLKSALPTWEFCFMSILFLKMYACWNLLRTWMLVEIFWELGRRSLAIWSILFLYMYAWLTPGSIEIHKVITLFW